VTTEVIIPNKLHGRLLASNRRLIRDVENEFGEVSILFPKEKGANSVTIRGRKYHLSICFHLFESPS
jgi:hypothetical protein